MDCSMVGEEEARNDGKGIGGKYGIIILLQRFSLLFSLRLVSSRLVSFDLTSFSSLVLVIFMDFPFLPLSVESLASTGSISHTGLSPLAPSLHST